MSEEVRHDPRLLSGGRHGAWCNCSCGWQSPVFSNITGAHLSFGRHLIEARPGCDATQQAGRQR